MPGSSMHVHIYVSVYNYVTSRVVADHVNHLPEENISCLSIGKKPYKDIPSLYYHISFCYHNLVVCKLYANLYAFYCQFSV